MPIIKQASSRRIRRGVLAALAVAIGSLAIAATASAAQLDVTVFCEPVGNYQISCETSITGGTAPYAIKWYAKGRYIPWWDNQQVIVLGCEPRSFSGHKAVVTDAAGVTRESSSLARCMAIAP